MRHARREVVIRITLGDVSYGIWCDTCLTSARYTIGLYTLRHDGPHRMATINRCRRCDDEEAQ